MVIISSVYIFNGVSLYAAILFTESGIRADVPMFTVCRISIDRVSNASLRDRFGIVRLCRLQLRCLRVLVRLIH